MYWAGSGAIQVYGDDDCKANLAGERGEEDGLARCGSLRWTRSQEDSIMAPQSAGQIARHYTPPRRGPTKDRRDQTGRNKGSWYIYIK